MYAGGECAQRVNDMPKVRDMVDGIMEEAAKTIRNLPSVLES
jgi:hypothetical protein